MLLSVITIIYISETNMQGDLPIAVVLYYHLISLPLYKKHCNVICKQSLFSQLTIVNPLSSALNFSSDRALLTKAEKQK